MALRKRGDVIAKKATTIAIVNQKGGTAKTTTCENLGIGLAMEGKKVLLVDVDPQGSLTISMGWQQPDELSTTLSTLMQKAISISEDEPLGFRYNPKQVIKLMGKRYLVGPVIFHRFDDDGNFASLTMSDMYAIQKYLESSSVTLMIDRDKLTCICID